MPVAASATAFANAFASRLSTLGLARVQAGAAQLSFEHVGDPGRIRGHLYPVTRTRPHGDIRRLHLVGWRLLLSARAGTGGRMVVAERTACSRFTRWLNRRVGLHPVPLPPPLTHLEAWCGDADWGRRLFADPTIVGLVDDLLPAAGPLRPAALHLHPGHLLFAAGSGPDGAALLAGIEPWREQLPALAGHADALPPPQQPWQPHWLEHRPRRVVTVVVAVLLLGLALGGGLLFGLAMLAHRLLHG
jgi:hypothetical protein